MWKESSSERKAVCRPPPPPYHHYHHRSLSSPSLCTCRLFLSIITHCSLARWSTINKHKIASRRRKRTISPRLCWSYSKPIKTSRFSTIDREIECVCGLQRDAELYLCVPANRSSVVPEYMSNGHGRDMSQCSTEGSDSASL